MVKKTLTVDVPFAVGGSRHCSGTHTWTLNTCAIHDVNPLILSQQVAIPSSLSETDTSHLLLLGVQSNSLKRSLFSLSLSDSAVDYGSVCSLPVCLSAPAARGCSAPNVSLLCHFTPHPSQLLRQTQGVGRVAMCVWKCFNSHAQFLPQGYFNSLKTCIYVLGWCCIT